MSSHTIRAFTAHDADGWDAAVLGSCNGTFLHSRRYLSYHGSRFPDQSVVIENRAGLLVGVLPAAVDPDDSATVTSHPGITYGGVVHDGSLRGEAMLAVLTGILAHYRGDGFRRLRYKPVPVIYHRSPAADDLYALFRLGGRRERCDLSASIDIPRRPHVARRAARRRAVRSGVALSSDWGLLSSFWAILEANLAQRYDVKPTHTLGEMQALHDHFPDEIILIIGSVSDEVVGGVILYSTPQVMHVQYSAASPTGRTLAALDPVMEAAIDVARSRGCRYFDFGTSNEKGGWYLNQTLYEFKLSFGAGGVVHEHYELDTGR